MPEDRTALGDDFDLLLWTLLLMDDGHIVSTPLVERLLATVGVLLAIAVGSPKM